MYSENNCTCASVNSFWTDSSIPLNPSTALNSPPGLIEDPLKSSNTLVGSSSVSSLVIPDPGNGFGQAYNIGSLNETQIYSNFVGTTDPNDYFRLDLSNPGNLNLELTGLSADANLQLFNSSSTLIGESSQVNNLAESINLSSLSAGTYYIRVYQSIGDTNYTLNLSSTSLTNQSNPLPPGTIDNTTNSTSTVNINTSNPLSTIFSVVDASGDNTPYTLFQEGAVNLSYDFQNVASLSNVRLEAVSNGSVLATLGEWNGASLSNQLISNVSTLSAGNYELRAVIQLNNNQEFIGASQSISIISNNRFNGTFAADTLAYSAGAGKGSIFIGRGGTDTLDLGVAGLSQANITSINGLSLSAFDPLSGTPLSLLTANQAIYGGTAFDYITLSDGREIYFQGIEYLRFVDGSTLELQVHPNDQYFGSQWNLAVSDVSSAWRFTQGTSNVLLASLDTGILTAVGANGGIVDISTDRLITHSWDDDNYNDYGHGHSAISIMSSSANNSLGIAGINWNSQVYVNDLYGGYQAGDTQVDPRITLQAAIANTMSYAVANNMRVVFQGGIQGDGWLFDGGTQAQLEALIQAYSNNAVFAIATGNGDTTGSLNVAGGAVNGVAKLQTTYNNVISVGALQSTSTALVNGQTNATAVDLAYYSNYGSDLTLVGATDSPAMDKFGNVNNFTGTSAANPNIAGIASLLWSVNTALTGGEVRQILSDTAMDLGTAGKDDKFGSGLANADAAVRRAVALQRNAQLTNLYSGSTYV